MNKKILTIGSIIACIIILLASLSPVVGYSSARSSVKDSPLFSVRTKRAINEESNALTCEYVGKGNIWSFPRRDNQMEKLSRAIDAISKMNDESFNNIVARIVYQKEFINIETSEVIQTLHFMRANPDTYKHVATQEGLRDYTLYFIKGFRCLLYVITVNILGFIDFLICDIITYFLSFRVTSCPPLCVSATI